MELAAAGAPRTAGHHGCRPVTRRGHDTCSEKAAGWQQAGEGLKGCCRLETGCRDAGEPLQAKGGCRAAAGPLQAGNRLQGCWGAAAG